MKEDNKSKNINVQELPKDLNKNLSKEDRKEIYKQVKEGKLKEHKQAQTYNNLKPFNELSKEELKEIQRKAAEKRKIIAGEKKTARESLEQFLPIFSQDATHDENIPNDVRKLLQKNPDIKVTQYDLIMLSMIAQARQGNTRAAEFIRDTYGDKPINETHNVNEIITESDKALIEKIGKRLNLTE